MGVQLREIKGLFFCNSSITYRKYNYIIAGLFVIRRLSPDGFAL